MGDLIFTDFKNKTGHYTKGGGIDDLEFMAIEIMNQIDTSPCEMPPVQPSYSAPGLGSVVFHRTDEPA